MVQCCPMYTGAAGFLLVLIELKVPFASLADLPTAG